MWFPEADSTDLRWQLGHHTGQGEKLAVPFFRSQFGGQVEGISTSFPSLQQQTNIAGPVDNWGGQTLPNQLILRKEERNKQMKTIFLCLM